MSDSFVIFDKFNSVAFQSFPLVFFNFNNNDYLIYYISEDGSNCKIYVSRLITNGNGNCSLSDLSTDEKVRLSEIVYKIVISFPSSYTKNIDVREFVNSFSHENNVIFSVRKPTLNEQDFCYNSYCANSDLKYISSVKAFYNYIVSILSIPAFNSTPSLVWSIPKPSLNDNLSNNFVDGGIKKIDAVIPSENASNFTADNLNVNKSSFGVDSEPFKFRLSDNVSINNGVLDSSKQNSLNILSSDFNISNEKYLNGFNSGNSLSENAGFASNRYIIIGTICLILASIIVAISIVFIKNL